MINGARLQGGASPLPHKPSSAGDPPSKKPQKPVKAYDVPFPLRPSNPLPFTQ